MAEILTETAARVIYKGLVDIVYWAADKIALATEQHNFYIRGASILYKIPVDSTTTFSVYPSSTRRNLIPFRYYSGVSWRQDTDYSDDMYLDYFAGGNSSISGQVAYTLSMTIDPGRPGETGGYVDLDTYRTVTIWFLNYKPGGKTAPGFRTVGQFSYRWVNNSFDVISTNEPINRTSVKDSFGVSVQRNVKKILGRLYLGTSNTLCTFVFSSGDGKTMVFDANIEQGTVEVDRLRIKKDIIVGLRSGFYSFTTEDKITIQIASTTDFFSGNSLSQSTFILLDDLVVLQSYSRYPIAFGKYVLDLSKIPQPCTLLVGKTNVISKKDFPLEVYEDTLGRIVLYGLLRYFLWYLIKGKFTLQILQNKYTTLFFAELAISEYAGFIKAFESDELKGLNVYFVESL